MRFYNVTRFGTYKIRYAEVASIHPPHTPKTSKIRYGVSPPSAKDILIIPSLTPKVMDPFLLWKQTNHKESFRILEIQDKTGHTWFEIKSAMPLSKILEISDDGMREMR